MDGFLLSAETVEIDPRIDYLTGRRKSDHPLAPPPLPFETENWPRDWDETTFLAFLEARPEDEKWELWDGEPRLVMTPATPRHQSITTRLAMLLELHFDERDMDFGAASEIGVRVPSDPVFLAIPDVVVTDQSMFTGYVEGVSPAFVDRFYLAAEVLSPSNTYGEIARKVSRYKEHPYCLYVLVMEQHEPALVLYARDNEWSEQRIRGADASLELPAFDFSAPLSSIYRRVIGQ